MRILVIRRDNIGDLVCTTPLFAALRARYRQAHIAALVNSYNAAVLEGNPWLDAVHTYTKLKHRAPGESRLGVILNRLRIVARLRQERFDYVVLAKCVFDRHGLALARPLRPRHIIGFLPEDNSRVPAITLPLPPPDNDEVHEVEVMMQLASVLDAREPPGPVRVFAAPELVAQWRGRFPALASGKRWVALHISAREPRRIWPAERFAELAGILARQNLGIVLLWAPGGADDPRHPGHDARAAAIATYANAGAALIPAKTDRLEELTAVLSLCHAFIGADGGALHIAAGLGLPIVGLYENRKYCKRHWHPWQVPYEMVCPETSDFVDISMEQVADAWTRLNARLGPACLWSADRSSAQ
jgi:heptosyltransferase-3